MKSIRSKAVLLTGAILSVAFAAVIVFAVESQRRSLQANVEARIAANTRTLESVLESVMLSGQADIMNDTLMRLREIPDFSELVIFRIDGSKAFGGGATTDEERAAILARPAMQEALQTSEPVQMQSADGTAIEFYSPIVAKPVCFDCHDPSASIRGVQYFRISTADALADIRRSSTLLAGFLVATALITGLAFVLFLGWLVTRPVTALSVVAQSLEHGDLFRARQLLAARTGRRRRDGGASETAGTAESARHTPGRTATAGAGAFTGGAQPADTALRQASATKGAGAPPAGAPARGLAANASRAAGRTDTAAATESTSVERR